VFCLSPSLVAFPRLFLFHCSLVIILAQEMFPARKVLYWRDFPNNAIEETWGKSGIMENKRNEFGQQLKRLREGRFTQDQLVQRLHDQGYYKYHGADVSRWEHGTRIPPADVVEALEDILLPAPDGTLLQAAGYADQAALKAEIQKLKTLDAWSKHVDGLVSVAQSIRYNLVVPTPARAQQEEYPIQGSTRQGLSNLEALQADLKDLGAAVRPGPKWYVSSDGTLEVAFFAEELSPFPGFMEHLKGTGLDIKYWGLKEVLREYIQACRNLNGKVNGEDLLRVPEVAELYDKSRLAALELAEKLDTLIRTRNFTGKCQFCR